MRDEKEITAKIVLFKVGENTKKQKPKIIRRFIWSIFVVYSAFLVHLHCSGHCQFIFRQYFLFVFINRSKARESASKVNCGSPMRIFLFFPCQMKSFSDIVTIRVQHFLISFKVVNFNTFLEISI